MAPFLSFLKVIHRTRHRRDDLFSPCDKDEKPSPLRGSIICPSSFIHSNELFIVPNGGNAKSIELRTNRVDLNFDRDVEMTEISGDGWSHRGSQKNLFDGARPRSCMMASLSDHPKVSNPSGLFTTQLFLNTLDAISRRFLRSHDR